MNHELFIKIAMIVNLAYFWSILTFWVTRFLEGEEKMYKMFAQQSSIASIFILAILQIAGLAFIYTAIPVIVYALSSKQIWYLYSETKELPTTKIMHSIFIMVVIGLSQSSRKKLGHLCTIRLKKRIEELELKKAQEEEKRNEKNE